MNTTLIRTRINQICRFRKPSVAYATRSWKPTPRKNSPSISSPHGLAEEDGLDPVSLIQVSSSSERGSAAQAARGDGPIVRYPGGQRAQPIDRSWPPVKLEETPSGVTGSWSYKNDLFEPNALQHWIADYTTILAKAATNPETSLGRLADN